jgi:hypothetical protein
VGKVLNETVHSEPICLQAFRPDLLPTPDISRSTLFLTANRHSGIIFAGLYWGVAKWQGTGFWSRDRRFESCRPSRGACGMRPPGRRTIGVVRVHV